MELHFSKWGNSLGTRFPKVLTEMLGISDGSVAQAEVVDGKLVISMDPLDKIKALTRGFSLRKLMAKMPTDYDPTKDEELRSWRDAPPVGKEIIDDDWS